MELNLKNRNNLITEHTKSCGCLNRVRGENNKDWGGYKKISGAFWSHIKIHANKRKLPFKITIEEAWQQLEKQGHLCALTGTSLSVDDYDEKKNASLDRINNSKDVGYIISNVQWVTSNVNWMKGKFEQNRFIEICTLVADYSLYKIAAPTVHGTPSIPLTNSVAQSTPLALNKRSRSFQPNPCFNKSLPWYCDIVGNKYGRLTIKNFLRREVLSNPGVKSKYKYYYTCECDCGNIKEVSRLSLNGGRNSCGCLLNERPVWNQRKSWTGYGEISGRIWTALKNKAFERELGFDITIEDAWKQFENQNGCCSLTGVPLIFSNSNSRTASLDRIDNTKGYLKDNIQWLHKDVNWMKGKFSNNIFRQILALVATHTRGKNAP